jgi:hypothetical protein
VIRRTLAWLAAALVLGTIAFPARAGAQERPTARLALASQTPWVRTSSSFTLRLDVDHVRDPARIDLHVVVHRAVTSRSQFARTIRGELLGASIHTDVVPFDQLHFDPGGAIPITISLANLRLGVYPVDVALVDHRTGVSIASLVTHLVRVPDEPVDVPLAVAWVQPYGSAPALHTDGTTSVSDAALDRLRTEASTLDDGVPLTVVPTPETISALDGIDDGKTVRALATLLQPHQVLSTPFVDVDVSALVESGRLDDLRRQRAAGDEVLRETLGRGGDDRTWSLSGGLTSGTVDALAALGTRTLVVDEDALDPLPSSITGGLTLTRPFAIRGGGDVKVDAVVVDAALGAHFTEHDDVLAAHHLLADLAVLQLDSPGTARGVVVRQPRGARPTDAFLSTVLADIGSSPLFQPVTIDGLLDTVDPLTARRAPVVRTVADTAQPSSGIPSTAIDEARASMNAFTSVAGTANPALRVFDRMLLVAESTDLRATTRAEYADVVDGRVRQTMANVHVLGNRTYRLTAREGKIPLTLVNDNPFDVRVAVDLTSDKLLFAGSPIAGRREIADVTVRANGTTTQAIPVKTRTSGAFPMRITVRAPSGLEIGRTTYTITSTVASGVGLFLSIGAVLFLLLWWGSHWRTVRRARGLVAADE